MLFVIEWWMLVALLSGLLLLRREDQKKKIIHFLLRNGKHKAIQTKGCFLRSFKSFCGRASNIMKFANSGLRAGRWFLCVILCKYLHFSTSFLCFLLLPLWFLHFHPSLGSRLCSLCCLWGACRRASWRPRSGLDLPQKFSQYALALLQIPNPPTVEIWLSMLPHQPDGSLLQSLSGAARRAQPKLYPYGSLTILVHKLKVDTRRTYFRKIGIFQWWAWFIHH